MEELLALLRGINDTVDYENAQGLVTNKIIDSIDISAIISEIEETFDIEITMEYMENKNFDTVEAMWAMIQELAE